MEFAFSEEQEMLRDTARRFLDTKSTSEVVRQLMETEEGFDPGLWSEIAVQGWQAMAIPEEYGGAGFTFMEQAILMEEMGTPEIHRIHLQKTGGPARNMKKQLMEKGKPNQ